MDKSGSGSNVNEVIFLIHQSLINEAAPSDTVYYPIQTHDGQDLQR